MLQTVTLQIGNSDNKLPQVVWSRYIREMRNLVKSYAGQVFFQGGSPWDAPWQNACWVFSCDELYLEELKDQVAACRQAYRQESVAMLVGITEFV
jgi:hypothetical protein